MNKTSFAERCKSLWEKIRKALGHLFFHNGWVKLLSLAISLVLWAGLISQDPNVTRNKTFQNVKISVLGSSTLSSRRSSVSVSSTG